jgi:hypothetical protein
MSMLLTPSKVIKQKAKEDAEAKSGASEQPQEQPPAESSVKE